MLEYIDLYFLEMSFNVGVAYFHEDDQRELHIFLGIIGIAIGLRK